LLATLMALIIVLRTACSLPFYHNQTK
jgi:hypothetical protein